MLQYVSFSSGRVVHQQFWGTSCWDRAIGASFCFSTTQMKILQSWQQEFLIIYAAENTLGLTKYVILPNICYNGIGHILFSFSFSTVDSHDICITKSLFKAAAGVFNKANHIIANNNNNNNNNNGTKDQSSETFSQKWSWFCMSKPSNHGVLSLHPAIQVKRWVKSKELQPSTLAPMHACWACVFGMDDVWG